MRYIYLAKVIDVIDGDTVRVDIDLGLSIWSRQVLRLAGINAPEMVGTTAAAGKSAKDALINRLFGKVVRIETLKSKEKYGRYLAYIWTVEGGEVPSYSESESVNHWLISQGLAVLYDGGKR